LVLTSILLMSDVLKLFILHFLSFYTHGISRLFTLIRPKLRI
jgi:hypothetical protein